MDTTPIRKPEATIHPKPLLLMFGLLAMWGEYPMGKLMLFLVAAASVGSGGLLILGRVLEYRKNHRRLRDEKNWTAIQLVCEFYVAIACVSTGMWILVKAVIGH